VLKIPQYLRTRWGIYKNLINGVTTVVHHGPWLRIEKPHEIIRVFQDAHSLHSIGFEKRWKWKLNRPFSGMRPYSIHIGEGTDETAFLEIDELTRCNWFKKKVIGIHGVAMTEKQALNFQALVWCPHSNYFLLGQTATVHQLKKKIPILFGTDSTLTSDWNLWEHLRKARSEQGLSDQELFDSLTEAPAKAWGLRDSGSIALGQWADLVIAQVPHHLAPGDHLAQMDTFFSLSPEDILLVVHAGEIRLFDEGLYKSLALGGFDLKEFYPVFIHKKRKYLFGDLPSLIKQVKVYHPEQVFPITLEAG
jgi:hypothetical protein